MNIADTREMLKDFPCELTPCIRGVHGTGKTEVIRMISKEDWHMPCVELQGSQLSDVGDLIGLQKIFEFDQEVIGEDGKPTVVKVQETRWIPPYWFPKDGKPITLFLDELNRAAPPIKRAMMQIGNDHRILNFTLPEGSRVIVAMNPNNEGDYEVEEFDDAENDRYWHMEFTPTVEEWEAHERAIGGLDWVINYFMKHHDDLDPYAANKENRIDSARSAATSASGVIEPAKQSRRSATRFDKVVKTKLANNPNCFDGPHGLAMLQMLASGYFGSAIGKKIKEWYIENGQGLKPAEFIIGDWKRNKKEIEKLSKNVITSVQFAKGIASEMSRLFKAGQLKDKLLKTCADNWYNYLVTMTPETAARIHSGVVEATRHGKDDENWVPTVSHADSRVRDFYLGLVDTAI